MDIYCICMNVTKTCRVMGEKHDGQQRHTCGGTWACMRALPAGDANGAATIRSRPERDLHIPQDTTRAEHQIAEKQVLTWWHV